jgi:hypothetical protein
MKTRAVKMNEVKRTKEDKEDTEGKKDDEKINQEES